jgi:hypothetical protein
LLLFAASDLLAQAADSDSLEDFVKKHEETWQAHDAKRPKKGSDPIFRNRLYWKIGSDPFTQNEGRPFAAIWLGFWDHGYLRGGGQGRVACRYTRKSCCRGAIQFE